MPWATICNFDLTHTLYNCHEYFGGNVVSPVGGNAVSLWWCQQIPDLRDCDMVQECTDSIWVDVIHNA